MGARASGDHVRLWASPGREGPPERSASSDRGRSRPLCTAPFASDAADNRGAGRRVARSPIGRLLDAGRTHGARRRARRSDGRVSLVEVRTRVGSGHHALDGALVRAVEGVAVSRSPVAAPTGLGADGTGARSVRDMSRLRLSGTVALWAWALAQVMLALPSLAAARGTETSPTVSRSDPVAEGYRLLDSGHDPAAEAYFRALLAQDPDDLRAREGLVAVYE